MHGQIKNHGTKIALAAAVLLGGSAIAANQILESHPGVMLQHPQQVVWQKPTTDAGWAEDAKQDQLDLRSTKVLRQMLVDHRQHLTELLQINNVMLNCVECVKYPIRTNNPTWTSGQVDAEYASEYGDAVFQVERTEQVIERIENELRLRDGGYLKVEMKKQTKFDATTPANRLRKTIE